MTVLALVDDLLLGSRIEAAARGAGVDYARVASLDDLPEPDDRPVVLFVAWDERAPDWGVGLAAWSGSSPRFRLVLFGPHTDLAGHRAAKEHGIGPVLSRSKLMSSLPELVRV
ncbi:MAG: hypothetical protein K5924_06360 [Chloroflexi bacterium]|nr:hypothetical protein [Chloroflexota bacterium]